MKKHNKPCRVCNTIFTNTRDRIAHEKNCRRPATSAEDGPPEFTPSRSALGGLFTEYCLEADQDPDYSTALQKSLVSVGRLLKQLAIQHRSFKYYIDFEAVMRKILTGFEDEFEFK